MRGQFLRLRRWRSLFEIVGRSDERHRFVRRDAHRDHVLFHLVAKPDADVEALLHDVGKPVVVDEFDLEAAKFLPCSQLRSPTSRNCVTFTRKQ